MTHYTSFPHPKFNALNRIAATTSSLETTIFFAGNGHNDCNLGKPTDVAANIHAYFAAIRAAWPSTVIIAAEYYQQGAGSTSPAAFQPYANMLAQEPAILAGLESAGGPWVYINTMEGTWQNSNGASGVFNTLGVPLITGTGYGGAPGYAGGHSTGVGNADLMIRDDGVHPSNIGAHYLGDATATAIIAGVLAL